MAPTYHTFEVVPSDPDAATFTPFLLEVPSLLGPGAAARRAYFTAMAHLAGAGVEPEQFTVATYPGGVLVDSGGLVDVPGEVA